MLIEKTSLWIDGVPVEEEAEQQLRNVASLPVVERVAVMPDCHVGKGGTVGSVIGTKGAILPATCGVDLGCGMSAVKTSLQVNDLDNLGAIRRSIERDIPVGKHGHRGRFRSANPSLEALSKKLDAHLNAYDTTQISQILNLKNSRSMVEQMGSLGGGNHFIELCEGSDGQVWVMLHSGSRGIGNLIGTTSIEIAKEYALKQNQQLPDEDLAWLDEGTPEFAMYVEALTWAQEYAKLNREVMMAFVLNTLAHQFKEKFQVLDEVISCHHNYASLEEHFGSQLWIQRKGALSAREGQLGIIPSSMGGKSYIVKGKGAPESLCSCSHGAGRTMSRTKAKELFTKEDIEKQIGHIESRKDGGIIDELPGAYKDIDAVMLAQQDLVEVVCELKTLLCIKG